MTEELRCPFCGEKTALIFEVSDGDGRRKACHHCEHESPSDNMSKPPAQGMPDPFWVEVGSYHGGYSD